MAHELDTYKYCRPKPVDDSVYLANPHKGCCTFQHFNGDALFDGVKWAEEGPMEFPEPVSDQSLVIDGYLPTTVAYCRWFWDKLEPEEGKYDFSMIDKSLETCTKRGQTLAVRLMPFGFFPYDQSPLPEWYLKKYPLQDYREHPNSVPNYNSDEYYEKWGTLISEFAKRYDDNPLLETFDVAYKGPWGEGDGTCSQEKTEQFAKLYADSFKQTPLLALIGGSQETGDQLKAGFDCGTGWRADCFGDLRPVTYRNDIIYHDSKNHMFNIYPQRITETEGQNIWQKAPVHMESCVVPMYWHKCQEEFDLDFVLQQGFKYHMTYFMPKSCRLPEKWLDTLKTFCNKIGYRFIFRQAIINRSLKPGDNLTIKTWIENIGVAPIYFDYDFAYRIRQNEFEKIFTFEDINIKNWLPGDILFDKEFSIPKEIKPGTIELSAGLIDRKSKEARINFANQERFCDRWLYLGHIEVVV